MGEVTGVAEMLSEVVAAALARVGLSPADPALRRSERADFQTTVALAVARAAGRPPAELACALADEVPGATVSGSGFLNLTAPDGLIWSRIALRLADSRLGVGTPLAGSRTVVDYSAPNAAKEMHVGHLRSTVIGDALVRVLAHLGADVVRQNHLGDWGTQFGMLIQYRMEHPQVPDLELYPLARKAFDSDADFADRSRKRVVALQSGDEPTRAVWRDLVASSEHSFQLLYQRLGVLLVPSDDAPESMYNPHLESVVSELAERGIAVESQGAWCVFLPGRDTPLIVRKKDGGFGYAATDLAALRYRVRELGADRVLYVIDPRQALHLSMVFETARLAGWVPDGVDVVHVAFGTVLGPDGKPFKSRAGDTVPLRELLDAAVQRVGTLPPSVAIGAVKYADLSTSRTKDYAFDVDRMTSSTGNTSVYLQYAHARVRSILMRLGETCQVDPALDLHPAERELALRLDGFAATLYDVAQTLEPHRLCGYLFELAQAFSRFFERCPVVRAESVARQGNRAALVRLTGDTLAQGLDLLGIGAPYPM